MGEDCGGMSHRADLAFFNYRNLDDSAVCKKPVFLEICPFTKPCGLFSLVAFRTESLSQYDKSGVQAMTTLEPTEIIIILPIVHDHPIIIIVDSYWEFLKIVL